MAGRSLESRKFARARASISLQYGETIAVRLRLPAKPSPALRKLAEEYFDPAGLLRLERYRSFDRVIEVFRQADLDAVVYSDALEYLDRENELAEGLAPARCSAAFAGWLGTDLHEYVGCNDALSLLTSRPI